jgi:hypothetical protein
MPCLALHRTKEVQTISNNQQCKKIKNNVMGVWICKVVKLFCIVFSMLVANSCNV